MSWHAYLSENEPTRLCAHLVDFQEARLREQARQLRLEKEAALEKLQAAQQDRDMAANVSLVIS